MQGASTQAVAMEEARKAKSELQTQLEKALEKCDELESQVLA